MKIYISWNRCPTIAALFWYAEYLTQRMLFKRSFFKGFLPKNLYQRILPGINHYVFLDIITIAGLLDNKLSKEIMGIAYTQGPSWKESSYQ